MSRPDFRRVSLSDPDAIISDLSTRQYLTPHQPLEDALAAAQNELGFCPAAAQTASRWLNLDPHQAIGRLRRTELIQLARSIHRFWRQAVRLRKLSVGFRSIGDIRVRGCVGDTHSLSKCAEQLDNSLGHHERIAGLNHRNIVAGKAARVAA